MLIQKHKSSSGSNQFAYPFAKRQILDSSKMKEFADYNSKFNKNGRKVSGLVENTAGQGEIARYEQFLLFPQCFQKTCKTDTLKPGLVWERVQLKTLHVTVPFYLESQPMIGFTGIY